MSFELKLFLSVSVFLVSFVWYFINIQSLHAWFNSKIGIKETDNQEKTQEK